ncbi:hypothetical protein Moror_1425 [Moniliophthora roreri MCA 2997]|uniref:DNA replication checkpoint mediator MRC1 domain-containing protein n=1 Tax=Moniliophthora roreri (strain MCA 2997) TaxID=1381753 RepID=V2XJ33_MONRO|nr:hypothetical protein Moror_1425 [Moniliophthora roreri MCA 2997]KAI3596673.1 hypothetical protein WG66_016424 [Moniliophthora roreri]
MPLKKEFSIVADSTASSSPTRPITPVKRAARTYGRPREPVALEADDPDRSYSSTSSSSLRSSIYRTGPLNTREEIPPSSPVVFSSPDQHRAGSEEVEEDQVEHNDAPRRPNFAWRTIMDEIDKGEHDGEAAFGFAEESHAEKPNQEAPSESLSSGQRESGSAPASRPSITPHASLVDDSFNGSLSTLTTSAHQPSSPGEPGSPILTNRKRIIKHQKLALLESDVEEEATEESSPVKHPINTPPRQSSPTPPTSDDDEMHAAKKLSSKGKGKASSTRQSVPPLVFQDETLEGITVASTKSIEKQATKGKGKGAKPIKTKKPTASERKEADKERARMKAEKSATVGWAPGKVRDMSTFMASLAGNGSKTPASETKANIFQAGAESSPILDFSSPHARKSSTPEKAPRSLGVAPKAESPGALSGSDDELPDISTVLKARDKRINLAEFKKRYVQETKTEPDDDDDLEIIPSNARLSGRARVVEKKVLPPPKRAVVIPLAKKSTKPKTVDDHNKELLSRVRAEEARTRKKKEEEWVRRGGKLVDTTLESMGTSAMADWKEVLAKKHLEAREAAVDASETRDEDESDEDWEPGDNLRGSVTPEPDEENENGDEELGKGDTVEDDTMLDDAHKAGSGDVDEDPFSVDVSMKAYRSRRSRAMVNSDTEDEDENAIRRQPDIGRVLVPATSAIFDPDVPMEGPSVIMARRGSCSSIEGGTEDEYDKENDTRRMYDHSEDKENTAVVRHDSTDIRPPLGSRQGSLLGGLTDRLSNRLSMSPGDRVPTDDENDENNLQPTRRQPLKPLRSEESLTLSPTKSFFERLQGATADSGSRTTANAPGPSLQPALNLSPVIRARQPGGGFSQFSDDESEKFAAPALQSGFADLFDSNTQFNPDSSAKGGFGNADKLLSLGLTQDMEARPMLAINEDLKRQADEIFEKEQGCIVERANRKIDNKPELYINDAGFLTQTRPTDGTPDIYRPLPTQSQALSRSSSLALFATQRHTTSLTGMTPSGVTQRTPFRDISLSGPDFENTLVEETPSSGPRRRRLMKRRSSSPDEGRGSPSPMPTPIQGGSLLDAFALHQKKKEKRERKPLQRSEFVEAEAQESDEETFGFVKSRDDDENGGEDLDKTLETLVDDKEMDENTIAVEKVLEKYKEHAEIDDKEVEALHMRAAQGELRKKRTRGVGVDDSDDEEDDEERARRIRRRMDRGARIDRQNIKELGDHPETRAFYNSYTKGIKDDEDNDLAYLQQSAPDFTMADIPQKQEGDEDDDDDNDNDDESGPGEVNRSEVVARLRQLAQGSTMKDEPAFDPHDVSWADSDNELDGDSDMRVKVSGKSLRASDRGVRRRDTEVDMDGHHNYVQSSSFMDTEEGRSRMESWASAEQRIRTRGGNGRSVAGAAITGHRKLKDGGGSLRRGQGAASSAKPAQRRPVRETPSLLNATALDRSSRFGQ